LKIPNRPVQQILKDSKGGYWFIQEHGLITKYVETQEIPSVNTLNSGQKGSKSREISVFREDNDGNSWVLYSDGLLQKIDINSLEVVFSSNKITRIFPDTLNDYDMVVDDSNNLWIYPYGAHGVFYYNQEEDQLYNFTETSPIVQLNSNLIYAMEKNADGNIWVGTDHGGINVINPENLTVEYIVNREESENSLSHNTITSLYNDRDGIMWIGTFKNGIDNYHHNIIRFPLYKKNIARESLPFNDVNVFAEDDRGNIYIGTNGGGLLYLNRQTGNYTQYLHQPGNPKSLSSNVVVSLLYDSRRDLWVGTYQGGLNKKTATGFEVYRHSDTDSTSIADDNVWELFEDSRKNLWVGTLGGGLDLFNREQEVFYHNKENTGTYGLHDDYVSSIAEDASGNMWIGGVNGIDVFNPLTGTIASFSHHPEDSTSLSSNAILSIYKDNDDRMWVGTQDGLNLYSEKDKNFYHYTVADGLPGKKIIAIKEDDNENLWITSSYGMTQFDIGSKKENGRKIPPDFRNYSELDGLQGNLFNENAMLKTESGELIVGGMHGFNVFDPQRFNYNSKKPKVVFTSFSLFNEEINGGEKINGRILLKEAIQKTDTITLKYRENVFSVAFSALDYFQPSKNKYRYKLVGFDTNWQETDASKRQVTYTNLDPGEYHLLVRASNNDQLWNDESANLIIIVTPPFYGTIYAYLAYILAIIAFLYFARKRIILRQRKNFQVEQVQREAAHLHEMDVMKIRFFTNISHEFKTPLSLILAPLEKLKSSDVSIQAKDQLDTIDKNAQKLLALINQLLDLGNIKKETLLITSTGNIIEFIAEVVNSFKELAKNEGIKLGFSSEKEVFYTAFDSDKLDKILFNLISNAIKFTPIGGNVDVALRIVDSESTGSHKKVLKLEVNDTGVGISKQDQEQIFERFFKAGRTGKIHASGSGIGLALVKEYVELYKGRISVESSLGAGTRFNMEIPLKELHPIDAEVPLKRVKKPENSAKIIKNGLQQEYFNLVIIDDDQDFLSYMTKSLAKSYKIFIAQNAEEGWKKILSVQPDLIICDWNMPGMNGTALCKKVRGDGRTQHIPFIMLTANAQENNKVKALQIGVSDYVTKPFSFEELHSRMQNLIKQRKSFQKAYSRKLKIPKTAHKLPLESEDEKFMRNVIALIEKNGLNAEFSVKELAGQLGVSRTFLYNKSVTLFEKSPLELITDIRLEHGKNLLENSQLTISEIAFKVGFNNPKYFTKNFKKKYQMLPSEFKATL